MGSKKFLIATFLLIILAGSIVIAEIITPSTPNYIPEKGNTIFEDINAELVQYLEQKNLLDFKVSELNCNIKTCNFTLFKQDAINKTMTMPAKYCSDANTETSECLEETYFTETELKQNRDKKIKAMLETYAKATKQRQEESATQVAVEAGTITIN